ncbi:MAG: FlgD immunoglobulin-like domain containing protein [candidate division WOR-3 bacterium]
MHKKIVFISSILFVSFVTPILAQNLLQNPSFENWTSLYQPANWTVEDTTYARVYKESTQVWHGSFAAKLKRLQAGTGNNKGLLQRITIPSRGQFVARARFLENTDSVSGGIVITWRDASQGFISSWPTVYTVNSQNWQVVQKIDTAPINAAIADFIIRTYGSSSSPAGGTFVVDSAYFALVGGDVDEANTNSNIQGLIFNITPNPFSDFTTISFNVDPKKFRCIKIYDATGNVVKTITQPITNSNPIYINWDGRDISGKLVPNGVYFITLETTDAKTKVAKALLLR